jgi:hypothetical protein
LLRPFLIQSARQRCKSFSLEHLSDRGRAQGELLVLEGLADFINRVVLFAQGDDERPGRRLFGLRAGTAAGEGEKRGTGIADKGMTQDAESARGIAEGAGDLQGGTSFDVIGAEGFVLALFRLLRLQEEPARFC